MTKPQISKTDILKALNFRRAMKSFDAKRKISDEDIELITEAIRLAPTSYGLEQFNVIVAQDPKLRNDLKKCAKSNSARFDASHVLIFTAKTSDGLTQKGGHIDHMLHEVKGQNKLMAAGFKKIWSWWAKKDFHLFDSPEMLHQWSARQAYIALGFAMMTAAERGIDSCPMEGFSIDKLAELLENYELIDSKKDLPVVMLALGYGNKKPHQQSRRDISEIVKWY